MNTNRSENGSAGCLFLSKVACGFPSPADDYIEGRLDLNEHLVKHPQATFFVRVDGESMLGAGIHNDDLLIVDRSLPATDDSVVVAVVGGAMTVKRLKKVHGKPSLVSENSNYPDIEHNEDEGLEIWGVATHVIHPL